MRSPRNASFPSTCGRYQPKHGWRALPSSQRRWYKGIVHGRYDEPCHCPYAKLSVAKPAKERLHMESDARDRTDAQSRSPTNCVHLPTQPAKSVQNSTACGETRPGFEVVEAHLPQHTSTLVGTPIPRVLSTANQRNQGASCPGCHSTHATYYNQCGVPHLPCSHSLFGPFRYMSLSSAWFSSTLAQVALTQLKQSWGFTLGKSILAPPRHKMIDCWYCGRKLHDPVCSIHPNRLCNICLQVLNHGPLQSLVCSIKISLPCFCCMASTAPALSSEECCHF